MSAVAGVWLLAAFVYAAFYAWYVGFQARLTEAEVDDICARLQNQWPDERAGTRLAAIRAFLVRDSGREFHMANLLHLRRHTADGERAGEVLLKYQKPFLRSILPYACHPIVMGRAASMAIECWGIEGGSQWTAAALVRYRSRRDFARILLAPSLYEIHQFKEAALEKTLALACDPVSVVGGGPKLVVPLLLIALASLFTAIIS